MLLILLLTPRALRRARVLQACKPGTNLLWQREDGRLQAGLQLVQRLATGDGVIPPPPPVYFIRDSPCETYRGA